ncbi:hypothetical protein PORY_001918 [Pneumocystis oryctolagi]|uniref:Uncharacterized protein n=1 Tax=Pneumocystis oryctolagi TaxID=42067 RepID=A0ACB7CBV6_9ASCO|nr:hypothetical protein PORY_001918 [Pneumocystis oryctolagi]
MDFNELRLAALLSQKKIPLQTSTCVSKDSNVPRQVLEDEQKNEDMDEKEEGEISDDPVSVKNIAYVDNIGKPFLKKTGYINRVPYKKNFRIKNNTTLYPHLYQSILSQNDSNIKLEGKLAVQFLFSQGISFEYLVHLGINKDFLHKVFIEAGLISPDAVNFQEKDHLEKNNINTDSKDDDKKCVETNSKNLQDIGISDNINKSVGASDLNEDSLKKKSQHVDSDTFLQSIRNSIIESSKKRKTGSTEKEANCTETSSSTCSNNTNLSVFNIDQEKKEVSKKDNNEQNKTAIYKKKKVLQEDLDKINAQIFQKELLIQKLKNELCDAESSFQKLFQTKSDIEVQLKDATVALSSENKFKGTENILMESLTNFDSISGNLTSVVDSKNNVSVSTSSNLLSNQNSYKKTRIFSFSNDKNESEILRKVLKSPEKIIPVSVSCENIDKVSENKDIFVEIRKSDDKFNKTTSISELFETSKYSKEENSTMTSLSVNLQKKYVSLQESKDITTDEGNFVSYKQYFSPLRIFHTFRYHPCFLSWVKGGFRSRTYSTRSDPNKKLCFFETSGGICNDDSCKYLHFKDIGQTDDQILVEISMLPVGETEEEQQNYRTGLHSVIKTLRASHFEDNTKIIQSVINYLREFLKDESRVVFF